MATSAPWTWYSKQKIPKNFPLKIKLLFLKFSGLSFLFDVFRKSCEVNGLYVAVSALQV